MAERASAPDVKPATFICEMCGADKPVDQVFQCQICMKEYCVWHLGTWIHDCFHNE